MLSTEQINKLAKESGLSPGEVRRLISKRISEARTLRINASTGKAGVDRYRRRELPNENEKCQIHLARVGKKPCIYKGTIVHGGYTVCGIHIKLLRKRTRVICEAAHITDRFAPCGRTAEFEYENRPVCFRHNNLLTGPLGTKSKQEVWQRKWKYTAKRQNGKVAVDKGPKV